LISNNYAEITDVDNNGSTALHWACYSGSYQAVRYLLAFGADINATLNSDHSTPMHLAFKNLEEHKELRIIHKLLLYGASIDTFVKSFIVNYFIIGLLWRNSLRLLRKYRR